MPQSQLVQDDDAHRYVAILRRIGGCGAIDHFDAVGGWARRKHKCSCKAHLIAPSEG